MQVQLTYGKGHLTIEVPNTADVIEPLFTPPLEAPLDAVRKALAAPTGTAPLRDLVKHDSKIAIVHCDGTRPMPNAVVLRGISEVLDSIGVPDSHVTLLNALGTHRLNTPAEIANIVGTEALRRYRSIQSQSTAVEAHRLVGTLPDGLEVYLHQAYVEADIRILMGFIEPHFFAGFSGGPKLVVPGVASQSTVEHLHRAELVGHPNATWGVLDGNPLWESLFAAANLEPPTFIVNVAMNRDKDITAVFAGDLYKAHRVGVAYVRERAMRPADTLYDIVVTTNSGFPLDQNLYQSVKGMSAAARIVRSGGTIIMASECSDGIPTHGAFAEIVAQANNQPEGVLKLVETPGFCRADQWQAQILALVCKQARVYLYSKGISAEQARQMMMEPTEDISSLLTELVTIHRRQHGDAPRICVLPEGPQTIPHLK